jgi:osmotically-inducible protein OsmY
MKSNAALQKDVYEELKWDSRVTEGDIGVSVSNGIITLSGNIPSYAEKKVAEEAARAVAGVTAVVNQIEVKLTGTFVRDDQDVARAAVEALNWNVWVPKGAIKVVIDKGWITLNGKVHYDYQRRAAENAVRNLTGVRGVSNHITVEPSVKPKDVAYQIKRALHRRAEEDSNSIQVDVTDDEVVLTGKVHSWDEKNAAEWAALGTAGVSKVINNVSISQA